MRPNDILIWQRFILANPDKFSKVYYDFKVGDGAEIHIDCNECTRADWYDLTRWGIDVVGENEEAIYVIEIKPSANAKALGQALSYAILFLSEHSATKAVIPVVLTDHEISSTRKVADELGIELWVA